MCRKANRVPQKLFSLLQMAENLPSVLISLKNFKDSFDLILHNTHGIIYMASVIYIFIYLYIYIYIYIYNVLTIHHIIIQNSL